MPVPSIGQLYVPVLRLLAERSPRTPTELGEALVPVFGLTENDLDERLPSGTPRFQNRVGWTLKKLRLAGLVSREGRALYGITEEGRKFLEQGLDAAAVRRRLRDHQSGNEESEDIDVSPDEQILRAVQSEHSALEQELLERVRQLSPRAFEQLVKRLLLAMGYGARGEGVRTGRTGDQGVDVEIAEDALGLERIYVQAKRYGPGSSVSSSELRDFVGALDMRGMNKGVFITSGTFAAGAREVAQRTSRRVVLIDGEELVRLMRAYGVGVRPRQTIVLHRLDEDFFSQLEEEA